ncbi:hypothetical protein [Haladaptatus pallidirubidus]|uniref:hypothetical protein n=1 Tax=Haladaptatus pallidirubidus TaxID=1008152 RepID=UPI001D0F5E74|nr:hypothetical protein [Haladaptatus pallidirubidus]
MIERVASDCRLLIPQPTADATLLPNQFLRSLPVAQSSLARLQHSPSDDPTAFS